MPPITAMIVSAMTQDLCFSSSLRYTQALDRLAGQSATVLLALAITGGMPAARSAGKEKKVPPPARAFMPPAIKAPTATMSSAKGSVSSSDINDEAKRRTANAAL